MNNEPAPVQPISPAVDTDSWTVFRTALDEAIVNIQPSYFRIKRYGDDDPEPRERAYCYELYHQLRLKLRPDFPYTLHAEVDKAGHAEIVRCFGPNARPNPDFILHKPTLMGRGDNLGIIEVKASDENRRNIGKDLRKIRKFLKCVGYVYGVMLFFGDQKPDLSHLRLGAIEALWHNQVGQKPVASKKGKFD